jgi:hypothetical protein
LGRGSARKEELGSPASMVGEVDLTWKSSSAPSSTPAT